MGKRALKFVKGLVYSAVLASALWSGAHALGRRTDIFDKDPLQLKVENDSGETVSYNVPTYNSFKVPPFSCSRYAKMAAKDLFGMEYNGGDAWDLKYENNVVSPVHEGDLSEFVSKGVLKSGMMVGIFNPKSKYLDGLDKRGNPREYTHIALYVGQDSEGNPLLAHQYGNKVRIENYRSLTNRGLEAREILAPKK